MREHVCLSVMFVGTTDRHLFSRPMGPPGEHGVFYIIAFMKVFDLGVCHMLDGMAPEREAW